MREERTLQLEVFKGKEASVNSYLFYNDTSIIVMDVLRNSEEARELVNAIKVKNLPLTHILVSHGHPDHYIGMEVLSREFPSAQIVVPSKEIKADIKNFSAYMESIGWLDGEPALKPKTEANPNGFDYDQMIHVLPGHELTLLGGGTLEIRTDHPAAEAEHLSTIFSKDLNALFTSDFTYNGVHLWLGPGVDNVHLNNWKSELRKLKEQYGNLDITVYPGHGDQATPALFDTVLGYINDFEQTVENAETKEEVIEGMKARYPSWEQADFLLLYSADFQFSLKNER